MRSIACGFLLLAISALPAAGQAPGAGSWPSLEEAANAVGCDSTPWAKTIADVKAADPARDAERQIAEGDFSLRSARSRSPESKISLLLMPKKPPSDAASSSHSGKVTQGVSFQLERQPIGIHCHLDVRPKEAFPNPFLEEATTDSATRLCGRAAMVLARDYASVFNRQVVGHPGYPHKDVCTAVQVGGTGAVGKISDRPTPDHIPAKIPDIATAARFGVTERVAKFIADGADVSQRDIFDFDALRWAVVRDYRPVFDLLLAAGGKPDFCAALEAAVSHDRVEPVAPLAQRCASNEQRLRLLPPAVTQGNMKILKALVDTEPALFLTEAKDVGLALGTATTAGRVDLVRLLLDRAAEPESSGKGWDTLRRSLLSSALAGQKLGVAELLLERGVDPGPNALHHALERKAPKVVRTLARHGTDLNGARPHQIQQLARTDPSFDPLGRQQSARPTRGDHRAGRLADPPIFLALDPLMDLKMVDLLLELGADPNIRDGGGRTPLMVAITQSQIYGKKDGVRWIERYVPQRLIEGQEDWDHRGVEPVRALLARGADVALSDRHGLTALHHAARSDYNVEIAEILLGHGANVNARDASGKTPLDHARESKLGRMPEVLVAAGARSGSQ